MTKYTNINIEIEDLGNIQTYFVYNQNTNFNDLLEFLAYYFPEYNICPCFKIQGKHEDINDWVDFENNWKFIKYINKVKSFKIFRRFKKCFCAPEYYKKSKKDIIHELIQKKDTNLDIIKVDNKTGQIIGNRNEKIDTINFYDVIINIKSIKSIKDGWKIKMSKRAEENYKSFQEDKVIKIGVIGNSNKGKSFILSKISKIELPSGTSIRTEGLSIKYPDIEGLYKNRKIVLLDSACLETPVLKEEIKNNEENNNTRNESINSAEEKDDIEKKSEKELFKEKSREKLMTELFLQNYIINNSDILIMVVGILTYSEQKLLNRIRTEIQKCKINKTLFVIHNLITFTSIEQVNEYINTTLLKSASFKLEKREKISTDINNKEEIYFYEKDTDPKIFHFLFANEGSEAGNYYNKFTIEHLENEFQRVTDIKPFDVIETVKERFIEMSKEILEKNEEPLNKNDFDNSDNNIIKLKDSYDVRLKKFLIDELGFSNLKANGFEPTYNY